jgi:hypothetical protein
VAGFATAEDFATHHPGDLSAAETATVTQALDMATGAIQSYTGQTLTLVTDDVVELYSTGETILLLPERPVVSITAVEEYGAVIAATGYRFTPKGHLYRIGHRWPRWSDENNVVEVTYTHGYATIPQAVKLVCLNLAETLFTNPGRVQSESIGSYSVSYSVSSVDDVARLLTVEDKSLLDEFRPLVVA